MASCSRRHHSRIVRSLRPMTNASLRRSLYAWPHSAGTCQPRTSSATRAVRLYPRFRCEAQCSGWEEGGDRMKHLGKTRPFRGPDGKVLGGSIAEVNYLRLGGVDQWVMIRARVSAIRR